MVYKEQHIFPTCGLQLLNDTQHLQNEEEKTLDYATIKFSWSLKV